MVKPTPAHSAYTASHLKRVCRIIEVNVEPMAFNVSHIQLLTLTICLFQISNTRCLSLLPSTRTSSVSWESATSTQVIPPNSTTLTLQVAFVASPFRLSINIIMNDRMFTVAQRLVV